MDSPQSSVILSDRPQCVRLGLACFFMACFGSSCLSDSSMFILLQIEAEIEKGQVAQLYVNDDFYNPYTVPIVPNKRHTYRFELKESQVYSFRFDPTNATQAQVKIHWLRFSKNEQVLEFPPNKISKFYMDHLKEVNLATSGTPVLFFAVSNGGSMQTSLQPTFP